MKTEITIKRENGITEVVDVSEQFKSGLTDQMFEQIKTATRDAGKGECISYKVTVEELTDKEKKEIEDHDEKCRWYQKHGFNGNDIN